MFASVAALAACGDDVDDVTGTSSNASVRFVNATNGSISVANGGAIGTGNSSLGFGSGSSCMITNTTGNALTFTNASTGATINGFTPTFTSGGKYTVVAYTDANGNTQFATLNDVFTPSSGQAGLRVFNAASGSGNIVINATSGALNNGNTVTFGSGGTFFNTTPGTQTLTFNTGTGTTTMATATGVNLSSGQNTTIFLGPAASGSTVRRTFVSNGC
jgi:hypothetical protein